MLGSGRACHVFTDRRLSGISASLLLSKSERGISGVEFWHPSIGTKMVANCLKVGHTLPMTFLKWLF